MKVMDLFCSSPASAAVIYSSTDKRSVGRRSPKTHPRPHDRSKSQLPRVPCSSHLPINPKPYIGKHRKSSAYKQTLTAAVDDLYDSSTSNLLSDEPASLVDWVPESDHVPVIVPLQPTPKSKVFNKNNSPALRSSSARSRNQVVVLRVSLHCKGCEGKVRKHISKMEGVTSFSVDLASKKVTIIGDVTPMGVLASVSKVKNAQLWSSPTYSSSSSSSHSSSTLSSEPSSPWST